jgi:hypothetical protein
MHAFDKETFVFIKLLVATFFQRNYYEFCNFGPTKWALRGFATFRICIDEIHLKILMFTDFLFWNSLRDINIIMEFLACF